MANEGTQQIGKVVQIIGPVVDVEFSDNYLPPIHQALRVTSDGFDVDETIDVVADAIIGVLPDLEKSALIARMAQQSADVRQVPVGDLKTILGALRGLGLKLGIATNDNEAPARANIAQADVIDDFALILGADSGFGGKPATGQLDQFCAVTGLAPAQCLMVGDSLHDLHAGAAAGMIPVGVLTGPAARETLAPHAAAVLNSIAELPDWIAARA